jgi:signal transduction histidine kinase
MSAYLLLPLTACLASSVLATALLTRDSRTLASRLSAALLLGATFWAGCEILWNTATDPSIVLTIVKLSAAGWVMIGPIGLHLILEVIGEPAPRIRRQLPRLYLISLGFLAVAWTTPWVHAGVIEASWGWAYEFGPAYPFFLAFTFGNLTVGLVLGARAYRRFPSAAERKQVIWITMGFLVPMTAASITDGILPMLGIQVLHLGTASFVVLGATVAWSLHRYGYTLLVPEAYSREIVDTMRDGLVMLRLDGRIRTANNAMARLAGCSRQELAGMQLQELIDPAPIIGIEAPTLFDCDLRPVTGSPFPVSISVSLLRDRQGEPCGSTALVRDQREVQSLRERLLLSGRMAAVGQLAAGVAHEINNPVAYVRANLVMLRQHLDSLRVLAAARVDHTDAIDLEKQHEERDEIFGEVQDLIDESLEGVTRTAAIVTGIREFSHAGNATREPAQLNDIVGAAHRMATPHVKHVADVHIDYGELPPLLCSAHEIQQVVLNLLINAADAVGSEGSIRMATHRVDDDVRLLVSDNGAGIDPDSLERIFDPFYTTKGVGKGTGLGLSISYEIINRHGGLITVESEVGRGTTFCVQLPLAPNETTAIGSPSAAGMHPSG